MLPEHQQACSGEHLAGEFVPVPDHPPYQELSPNTWYELPTWSFKPLPHALTYT